MNNAWNHSNRIEMFTWCYQSTKYWINYEFYLHCFRLTDFFFISLSLRIHDYNWTSIYSIHHWTNWKAMKTRKKLDAPQNRKKNSLFNSIFFLSSWWKKNTEKSIIYVNKLFQTIHKTFFYQFQHSTENGLKTFVVQAEFRSINLNEWEWKCCNIFLNFKWLTKITCLIFWTGLMKVFNPNIQM